MTTEIDELVKRLHNYHDDPALYKSVSIAETMWLTDNWKLRVEAATAILAMRERIAELEGGLKPFAEMFADAQGHLTPDYGEVSGRDFQMMTMHPDPEGLASDLRNAARALGDKP